MPERVAEPHISLGAGSGVPPQPSTQPYKNNMNAGEKLSRSTIVYRVQNTLSRINDLPEKDDLRRWPPNARRALRLAGDVSLVVAPRHPSLNEKTFTVPKLALMVASPTLREFIIKEPEVVEIELAEGNFESSAVGLLCYWLTSICGWDAQAVPYLPCPDSLLQTLELRHTAQLLSMDKYVRELEIKYILDIQHRIPCLSEALAISMYTLDDEDSVLKAWASRVGHLRRSSCFSLEYLENLAEILGLEEHQKLLRALDDAESVFQRDNIDPLEPNSPEGWPLDACWIVPSNDIFT